MSSAIIDLNTKPTTALVPFAIAGNDPHRRGTRILYAVFATLECENTRRSYGDDLEIFRRFMIRVYRQNLTHADVVDRLLWGGTKGRSTHVGHAHELADYFRADQFQQGYATKTVYRRRNILKAITRTARRLGLITWALDLKSIRLETRRETAGPALPDLARLLDSLASSQLPLDIRDHAVIRLLFDCALRRAEVASLDLADLNLDAKTIRIKGKGRRERQTITLADPTCQALQAWLTVRGDEAGPLFVILRGWGGRSQKRLAYGHSRRITGFTIYAMIRRLAERQGFRARPHGLRHSSITAALKAAPRLGLGLDDVLEFSRHARIDTLLIYRDTLDNKQPTFAAAVAATIPTQSSAPAISQTTKPTTLRLTLAEE